MKEKLQSFLIKNGFFFYSADIYGGNKGFFDYGPVGIRIKNKFIKFWKKFFIKEIDNAFEIDGALILPYEVLKASGHVDKFTDPIVICKKCNKVYRADHLLKEKGINVLGMSIEEINRKIKELNIKCLDCGGELSEVIEKNLMFKVEIGYGIEKRIGFLRPETAQSIFINFLNVLWSQGAKLPFVIFQVGKSFRNEISPRKFLIRLREFYQLEIEHYFIPNDEKNEKIIDELYRNYSDVKIRIWLEKYQKENKFVLEEFCIKELVEDKKIVPNKLMGYYLAKEFLFYEKLGIPYEDMYFRQIPKEELPHYSKGNFDLEVISEYGNVEVVGNAYRTDFDTRNHSIKSGKDMSVSINGNKIYPHVVEPSFGLERSLLIILEKSFVYDKKDRKYEWLKLPSEISPYKVAVLPLVSNKEEIVKKAKEIYEYLKESLWEDGIILLEKDSIGKRYSKCDMWGIPYAITVDYQTLVDNTVTIRYRDSKTQIRVRIDEILEKI